MNVRPPSEAPNAAATTSPAPDPSAGSPRTQGSRRERPRTERRLRGFERLRSASDASAEGASHNKDEDLELTLLLLREENARLKAERHRPPDVGGMIEQLRRLAADQGEEGTPDDAWSLLTECLLIREELDQACIEIKAAIEAVHTRLRRLRITLDDTNPHTSLTADPDDLALPGHARAQPPEQLEPVTVDDPQS
jgi:hypothetical protein